MDFKEYLNESLIVETKVKVAGREFPSKKDAGLFLAGQGKAADQIERMTGLSAAGAKWCIAQSKKGEKYKPEPLELAKLDKEKPKAKVKDWLKTHGDDHLKKKDEMSPMMKAFHKELKQYEKLATKGKTPNERRYYKEMVSRVKERIRKVEAGIPLNLDN